MNKILENMRDKPNTFTYRNYTSTEASAPQR